MSKRLLFVITEGGGNVAPQLGLARRLAARGHRVRVLGDPAIEAEVGLASLEFARFRHAPHHNVRNRELDRIRDWAEKNPLAVFRRATTQLMFGPAAAYARDLIEALSEFPADAIAVDYMIVGAAIGAERTGIPTALLIHTPYPLPAPGAPPFGFGFLPARSVFGRVRDLAFRSLTKTMFDRLGLSQLNAARTGLGLPAVASVYDQFQRADRILVMTSRRFDFAGVATLPERVRYVGPGLDDPTWVQRWTPPRKSSSEKLVVVSLGSTFQKQRGVTQRLIGALGGLPIRGLVTLGDVFDPSVFDVPQNVLAVRSAPHNEIFKDASCIISHGGHGTVMKAIASGLPVLCVPLGRDQADNAARVVASGSGLRARPTASVAELRRAISRLLDDPCFTLAARTLAKEIAIEVRRDAAVAELEELSSSHRSVTTQKQQMKERSQ